MRKTRVHFFTIADYEEEEIWLREWHKKGWRVVNVAPPCFYTFESCEPEDVIYRLDFKNNEQTEEYLQMLADFGWEYFDQCTGWLYFRRPAAAAESENEGELFSDNVSRADLAGKVARTRLLPLVIIFFCCILPNLARSFSGHMGVLNTFFAGFFSVMFVIYVYLLVYCGIKLKRLRRRYRY